MIICVVGGGPAGMIAAIEAAKNHNKVFLIEQNEKLGKKLFLTGKGRCNITNSCVLEELFQNICRNPKFMYSAIYDFDNTAVIDMFETNGLRLKNERGNRIFPVSDHSSDVIATLRKMLINNGVEIMLNTRVSGIASRNGENGAVISGVILSDGRVIDADRVVLATGGKSYPTTGSDGKSFEMLDKFGIDIKELQPSLVPLVCQDDYIRNMQGLSLKNVEISMLVGGKRKYSAFGEMLFTHFGVSGPLILSASTCLGGEEYKKDILINIDLKPALSRDELDKRILRDFSENQNKIFENVLGKLVPSKMHEAIVHLSGIDSGKRVNLITKQERATLVDILKCFPVKITGNRGFNEAIITRGGVNVKEINPSSMECKKVKGLYFAGEMIDVDAFTGGFNLQVAWSTGHLAGESCGNG